MNKDDIRRNFEDGDVPTGAEFSEWIERCLIWVDDSDELPEAQSGIAGSCYLVGGTHVYRCEYVDGEWKWVLKSQNGTSSISYLDLTNKPRLNGVVVSGEKTSDEFGLMPSFKLLKSTARISDGYRIVIGTDKGAVFSVTLAELRSFLGLEAAASVEVESVAERKVIAVNGRQDGTNTSFTTEEQYVPGSSALYLNGQRLYPALDYEETGGGSFRFTETAPKPTDRIMFEAVAVTARQ